MTTVTEANTLEGDVRSLVARLHSCLGRHYPQMYGSPYQGTLHGPPPPAVLSDYLARQGSELPPSYRAFLAHHNGWSGYVSGFTLIGVDGTHTMKARRDIEETLEIIADTWQGERGKAIAEQLSSKGAECAEDGPEVGGMIPFGTDFNGALLVFDPATRRSDREMEVLLYDTSGCSKRFHGFIEMLREDNEEVCQEGKAQNDRESEG